MILSQRLKYALFSTLFIIATLVLSFSNVQLASAATLTWDGSAGDGKFSTGANWSTDAAPVDGDIITFTPLSSGTDYQTIVLDNDLVGVEFAGIVVTQASSGFYTYFQLDDVTLQDGATISKTGTGPKEAGLLFGTSSLGTLTALGDLTLGDYVGAVFDVAGNLTANDGVFLASGSQVDGNLTSTKSTFLNGNAVVTGTITNADNAEGLYVKGATRTIASNFVFNDFDEAQYTNQIGFGSCAVDPFGGAGATPQPVVITCQTYADAVFTLSGDITLNADLIIAVASKSTVRLTGTIDYNGHTITQYSNSTGTLEVGGEAVEVPEVTTTLDDDDPLADVTVNNRETAILSGTRDLIQVQAGGTLKGTGTTNSLYVYTDGIVAPGNSPGTLTVLTTLSLSGIYEAEVLNEDTYDQLRVGEDYSGGGGNAVIIDDSAFLSLVLYDGWSVEEGDEFTIIDNRSDTDVSGTFANLDEGTQFTVEDGDVSIVFSITYVGGDGNDVVVTALNAGEDPTPPNTGVAQIIMANPIVLTTLMAVSVTVLAIIAIRRRQTN